MQAVVPGGFTHQPSGITYTVSVQNGQAYLAYDRPASAKDFALHGSKLLDLYVGSGHRGRTYLYHTEDWWFEAPINYYSGANNHAGGYDMAPNFLHVKQMPFNLPVDSGCLHCHASGVQLQQPGSRNRYKNLPFTQGGITCEACHGDATAHVASGGKAAVLNPSKLTPQRRDAVCYRCHLEGETNVENAAKSPALFQPGDRLEDYATYFVHEGSTATTDRAVSQVEALNLSGCKRASGDKMTCTTCHDPHGNPAPEERVQFYRAKCLQCHTQQKFVSLTAPHAHHPEQTDCAACHMPRVSTVDIAHSQSTDHRIPRRKGEYETAASTVKLTNLGEQPAEAKLVPVPGTTATPRDTAIATFDLIALGDLAATQPASDLLRQVNKQAAAPDPQVLSDLAWLAQHKQEDKQAAELYAEALTADPQNIAANTNYGVLLAQAGQLRDAARLWNQVFRLNPGISELGFDLGTIECALGNRPAAERILQRLLTFQPDDPRAQKLLDEITSERKKCGE
jgi:predicted CXXCH cytochrome family protein